MPVISWKHTTPTAEILSDESAFTEAELRALVEKASTIHERLGGSFDPIEDAFPDEGHLTRWCEVVAQGDWETFKKRLQWDGLCLEQARKAVRPVRLSPSASLPLWTKTLNACVAAIETAPAGLPERFCIQDDPVPFEDLLAPIVRVASRMMHGKLDGAALRVSEAARGDFERQLLLLLATLSAQAFFVHFSVYRATSALPSRETSDREASPDIAYQAFVETMRCGEMRSFLQEYAVLARMIATSVDNWIATTVRFLRRLHTDWEEISRAFSEGNLGVVDHIECGIADRHRGGDSTLIVHCESGIRFVYKPKNLGVGLALQRLIAWCNEQGLQPPLRTVIMINKADYGWMEFVYAEACQSPLEAENYFRRAGALVGLAYLLRGKDFHYRNIIASKDQPVLVDLEMLMIPSLIEAPSLTKNPSLAIDEEAIDLENSVLGTMMLPRWIVDASKPDEVIVRNLSGFAGEKVLSGLSLNWTHINTDRMGSEVSRKELASGESVPTLNGEVLHAPAYIGEIQTGFERIYGIVQNNIDDLLHVGGPLSYFCEHPIRFVFRSTSIYGKLLRRLRNPRYQQNGIDSSIASEALVRGYLHYPIRPPYWSLIRAEQDDLAGYDVPCFTTSTTGRLLYDSKGKELGLFFSTSGYEAVQTNLKCLDKEDLEFQKDLIWASFYTQEVGDTHDGKPVSQFGGPSDEAPLGLTETWACDAARRIVDRLHRTAVWEKEEKVTWIVFANSDPRLRRYRIRRIGMDLHTGRCGIALFLAAYAHVTSDRATERALIDATLRPLSDRIWDAASRQDLARRRTLGGTFGLGSYIYALTKIGVLLNDEQIIDSARVVASLITDDKIEEDGLFDVFFGAAGAVLGLLALYRETGDEEVFDRAIRCGQHLLLNREVEPESGCRAWRTLRGRFHTGLAHGAAGIAHALAELHRTTGDRVYLDAALEAFAFERTLFVPEVDNWWPYPAYREGTQDTDALWSTWCRGATGIGLARVANLDLFSNDERRDVEAAVRATQGHLSHGVDHACCGEMGRIALLMRAATVLGRPRLAHDAQAAARRVVSRARARDSFTLTRDGRDMLRPGFFQGLSGIGYQLIELAHLDRLPSVMLLS